MLNMSLHSGWEGKLDGDRLIVLTSTFPASYSQLHISATRRMITNLVMSVGSHLSNNLTLDPNQPQC